jgi:hypothetical protein
MPKKPEKDLSLALSAALTEAEAPAPPKAKLDEPLKEVPYDWAQTVAKRNALPPQKRERVEQLMDLVDHYVMYGGLMILQKTSWWLGWKSMMVGKPILTADPEIPTACVAVAGPKVNFYFNVFFAATLSPADVAFVIAHECMHLALWHLPQMKMYHIAYQEVWNIVTDAYINERLHRTLKWKSGIKSEDQLNWTLKNGIRWTDLPPTVRKQYPLENDKTPDVSCIDLYDAVLKYLEEKGIDPDQFERAVENKRLGRKIKRKKRADDFQIGAGDKGESVFQRTYAEIGDIARCKSKNTLGIIKNVTRTPQQVKDQTGSVEMEFNSDLSEQDWIRANRGLGIVKKVGKTPKGYPTTKKIVDAYAKLLQAGGEPDWNEVARLTGFQEITILAQLDVIRKQYDAETIMTPEEIEAEELKKLDDLIANARGYAGKKF